MMTASFSTEPAIQEFHFGLHTCNLGSKSKTVVNPFTQQQIEVPVDDGLSEREAEAVRKIFAIHEINGPFDAGYVAGYSIYCNEWINFRCFELDGPTPVEGIDVFLTVSDLSDEFLDIVLDIARKGNLALTSQFGKFVRIIDRPPNSKELARWPDAKKLSSTAELRDWLQEEIRSTSC